VADDLGHHSLIVAPINEALENSSSAVFPCTSIPFPGVCLCRADSLDAEIRGFVSKDAPLTEIVRADRLVAEGRVYIDPVPAGFISHSTANGNVSRLT
jgi:hypothetical protein